MATYPLASTNLSQLTLERIRYAVLLTLGVLVGIAITVFFVRALTMPYLGADASLVNGEWFVERVDSNGTAHRDGIQTGDRIVKANGRSPGELAIDFNYIGAHSIQSLEVQDPSGLVKHSLGGTKPVPPGALRETVAFFTVCAAFLLVAFLSFLKRPGSRMILQLYLMSLAIALAPMASLDSTRGPDISRHLEVVSFILSPWLAVRFFLEFPFSKRLKLLRRDISGLTLLAPALLLLVYMVVGHNDRMFYPWFRPMILIDLIGGFLLAFAVALHSYFTAPFSRFKQQTRIVAVGGLVGMLPLVAFNLVPELLRVPHLLPTQITVMGFVALPVSLGYVTLQNRLVDIDLAISRLAWYALLSCALVASYVFIISLADMLAPGMDVRWRIVLLLVFTMIALASSGPVRARLHQQVEARFNRGRYDYRHAASEIIADLATRTELEDVAELLATDVSRFLKLRGACVILNIEGKDAPISVAQGWYADHPDGQKRLVERYRHPDESNTFPNMAPPESGAAFLVPLSRGKKQVGILALSEKTSGLSYSVDDTYFLFSIQAQGSLAVDNALLLKEAKTRALDMEYALQQLQGYAAYLEGSRRTLQEAYLGIIKTLALALESRTPYTRGHSERVTQLSRRIGTQMGLSASELEDLQIAGRIHDIGKLGIPDCILLKSGPLEHQERAEIELHPSKGVEILRFLEFLKDAIPMIENHHEWYNGGGYPRGIIGDEIPLGARILAVADAFDAMTSDRPYRKACASSEAITRLEEGSGTQWDPKVVEAVKNLPGLGQDDA